MLTACNVGGIPDKVLDIAESRMDTTGYVGRTIPVGAYRSLLVDGFASVRYNAQTTGDARVEVRVHKLHRTSSQKTQGEIDMAYAVPPVHR